MSDWLLKSKQGYQDFRWSSPRTINSIKTAIGCLIGYVISYAFAVFFSLPLPQWIVITILVVMSAQHTIGGLLIKSYMRFWGTAAGVLIASSAILLIDHNLVGTGIVLFLATLGFAYVAGSNDDISVAGALGPVTMAIILLGPNASIGMAGIRFLEITVGIIIAFLVSSFILPFRSHVLLFKSFATTLRDLQTYFDRCLSEYKSDDLPVSNLDLDEKITKSFPLQRKLLHETAFERSRYFYKQDLLKEMLNAVIKIYRFINMLYYSAHSSAESAAIVNSFVGLTQFKQQISESLTQLADALDSKNTEKLKFSIDKTAESLEKELKDMASKIDYEHLAAVDAFLFSARWLIKKLKKMAALVEEVVNL